MDIYHVWFSLKDGVRDLEFVDAARGYFEHLKSQGHLSAYRITRCKLGLSHSNLPEWQVSLEFDGLAELDLAFRHVSGRRAPAESFHHAVNSWVKDVKFALYRDFPDRWRTLGEEKF